MALRQNVLRQNSNVKYLGYILDESFSGESMDIYIINKINSRLRFLYQPNKFLNISLRRLMWNSMIQPFPNYACNGSYPKANKKLKIHLQAAQNTYFPKIGY